MKMNGNIAGTVNMDCIQALEEKRGVIAYSNIGLCIRIEEMPDGRAAIMVDPSPIEPGYDGPELREFMEEIAIGWLKKVAPHRLSQRANP